MFNFAERHLHREGGSPAALVAVPGGRYIEADAEFDYQLPDPVALAQLQHRSRSLAAVNEVDLRRRREEIGRKYGVPVATKKVISHDSATHEAGHAVVAHLLGFQVVSATIVHDGQHVANTRYADRADLERKLGFNKAIISYAGYYAELIHHPLAPQRQPNGHGTDMNSAVQNCPDETLRGIAAGESERLVRENGPAIKAVAAALTAHHTLCGADVAELVRRQHGK